MKDNRNIVTINYVNCGQELDTLINHENGMVDEIYCCDCIDEIVIYYKNKEGENINEMD